MTEPETSVNTEEEHTEEKVLVARKYAEIFFTSEEKKRKYMAWVLATILFILWVLRSGFSLDVILVLCIVYSLSVFVMIHIDAKRVTIKENEDNLILTFEKSGVSWRSVFDALMGLGIIFILLYFVTFTGGSSNPELAEYVAMIAILFQVIVVPISHVLSYLSRFRILRTSLVVGIDPTMSKILDIELHANPLDSAFYENREDPELLDELGYVALSYVKTKLKESEP